METQKKTLSKLKLNKLSENELEKREMKILKGGCGCSEICNSTSLSTSGGTQDATGYG